MKKLLALLLMLALPAVSAAAQAETPDECAARLDQSIAIRTYNEAANWWAQVEQECAPDDSASEEMIHLQPYVESLLLNTECVVNYGSTGTGDDVVIAAGIYERMGNEKLYWRQDTADDWIELQHGESHNLASGIQFTFYYLRDGSFPTGAGIHQFELRTDKGTDKFKITATSSGDYAVGIGCASLSAATSTGVDWSSVTVHSPIWGSPEYEDAVIALAPFEDRYCTDYAQWAVSQNVSRLDQIQYRQRFLDNCI